MVSREAWSAGPVHLASAPVSNPEAVGGRDGSRLFASRLLDVVAVGLPPQQPGHGEPLTWTEWMFVVAGFVLSFYCSVRLVTWIKVKISSLGLSWGLRRELNARRDRPPSGTR